MTQFYATIHGNRGPATRMGSKSSGIHVAAQSREGSVSTNMYMANCDVYVRIVAGPGSSAHPSGVTIYDGPISKLLTEITPLLARTS